MTTSTQAKRESTWANWAGAALIVLGIGLPAFGALGGDINSVHEDQAHMKASIKTTSAQAFTVHEIKAPIGTIVHEYVSNDGAVFAVAWHGPSMPPMQQILGTYFQQFADGAKQRRDAGLRHGPLNIHEPGLVVQSNGHPHGYFGRAYVPAMLPQGVTLDQIR